MFAKLLKYEWKSSSKVLGVLSLAALGVGIVGAVVLRMLVASFTDGIMDGLEGFMPVILGPAMMMVVFGMIAYAYGSIILLLYRFYKSKFTDEGYLTFTLPVTSHQIFLSSGLNMLFWTGIIAFVVFVDIFLIMLFGTADSGIINTAILEELPEAFLLLPSEGVAYMLVSILYALISAVSSLVMIMTSITIGAVVAKKHKILASIGIYYGISSVMGIASGVISVFSMAFIGEHIDQLFLSMPYLGQMLLHIPIILGGYFLSTHLMKNKLNLP